MSVKALSCALIAIGTMRAFCTKRSPLERTQPCTEQRIHVAGQYVRPFESASSSSSKQLPAAAGDYVLLVFATLLKNTSVCMFHGICDLQHSSRRHIRSVCERCQSVA
jgi:hypothetical protein